MSYLLDASVLIASGWETHISHDVASLWLKKSGTFATCPVVQMAFMRVSMSQVYGVSFDEAASVLAEILDEPGHRLVHDSTQASDLPVVVGNKEITDAHLITLAKYHGLKLATLDKPLSTKAWARGVAEFIG